MYRRAEGVKVDLYILLKKILHITMMEYVYNNDHANYNYISLFGYILSGSFAVFHFKTGLHLLKDKTLRVCFFQRKPEINRRGQDTTLSLTCIAIWFHTFTSSMMKFLFFDKFLSSLK